MKKNNVFLFLTLACFLSPSFNAYADSYWQDTSRVLRNTASYLYLRTSESCRESINKLKSIKESLCDWWYKPHTPTIIVVK